MRDPITGVAAGVPFVALPPKTDAAAPVVVGWHLLGTPGTPAALAAALPLSEVPAWRIYLELPGTGAGPAEFADLLLDGYAPIVEQAVATVPAVLGELRTRLPIAAGPIALLGGSAGGHAALLTLARAVIEVSAAVLINPAVRAETVITVNERLGQPGYTWTGTARQAAARMDVLAEPEGNPDAAILLLTGEHEYPEFQPDQARLHQALARRSPATDHRIVPGLAHMFAENPGTPTKADEAVAEAAQDWLLRHFVH
ncbi:MAG TPA: hypothetical protein VG756_21880 [Pseudonocardiaceae bacterium]|nr:hypothetical protein [Pseudonocardiaceae bacterium]